MRRTLLGISQDKLGQAVDLTFQQIQKYERGANRIGASRLFEFSRILDVPVEFFFDDMPKTPAPKKGGRQKAGLSDAEQAKLDDDPMTKRETLELVRAYYKIPDARVRKRLYELIRSIGDMAK
ncbi:MAG: helix-turn-helix domain-containing protein [Alphaproteobacteria bacterium]